MAKPSMRQLPCTLPCTQEMFYIHPSRILQLSPCLLEPLTVNKNMLRSLHSLPTGAAWGANPWDSSLVEKGRQASLPSTKLGKDRATGLGESLIEFQIASPWGPWAQFPPGCLSGPPLIFLPGLKHSGCLAILDFPRLPPPGQ